MDSKKKYYLSIVYIVAVMAVIFSMAALSTFAWFTSNQKVYTTTVNATTGSDDVKLLLGGTKDQLSENTCVITQDNMGDEIVLYPVSSADLKHFVAMEGSGTKATYKTVTDQDQYSYHGVFYLQALSDQKRQVTLYLDEREESLLEAVGNTEVLNASRFGLVINGQGRIITLTDENNAEKDQIENTYLNGEVVGQEQVITVDENGNPVSVSLQPLYMKDAAIQKHGETDVYPDYMYTITTNEIYACDVYFYLEGTDKDCSDAVSFQQLDLAIHLAGVVG